MKHAIACYVYPCGSCVLHNGQEWYCKGTLLCGIQSRRGELSPLHNISATRAFVNCIQTKQICIQLTKALMAEISHNSHDCFLLAIGLSWKVHTAYLWWGVFAACQLVLSVASITMTMGCRSIRNYNKYMYIIYNVTSYCYSYILPQ